MNHTSVEAAPWEPEGLRQQLGHQVHGDDPNARTERESHEVAVTQAIPTDARRLGLMPVTAPGLDLVTGLNPDNPHQMRRLRWFLAFLGLPVAVVAIAALVGSL